MILDLLNAPDVYKLPGREHPSPIPGQGPPAASHEQTVALQLLTLRRPSALHGLLHRAADLPVDLLRRPIPLASQGHRFSVEFDEAVELASQASVQISGVPVGHVVSVRLDHQTGLSRAVIEINKQYAPRRPTPGRSCARRRCSASTTYLAVALGSRQQGGARRQPPAG